MRKRWLVSCFLAGLVAAAPATAGTVIEAEGPASAISRILVDGGRLRMEGGDRVVVFDTDARRMTILDPASKAYNRLDEADVRQLARQMAEMRAQIEKQLEQFPEGQREQMRRQMEAMLPGVGTPPVIRVEPTGGTGSVAGASCREARVFRDGEVARIVCVADPADLGIAAADFDTMLAMFGFFEEVAGAMGGGDAMSAPEIRRSMDELGGIPARVRSVDGNERWEIRSVESRSIPADRFAVPSGYQRGGALGGISQ